LESSWTRPANLQRGPVYFESIDVRLDGEQPRHRLLCSVGVRWEHDSRPAVIGISILDRTSTAIIQTGPRPDPFIGGAAGVYQIDLAAELPPLIPGLYGVGFWIGPSHTETYDNVRLDLAIEIVDNPSAGRTATYIPENGCIFPPSTASVRKVTGLAPFECVAK
jgi:lipopolysaccharide transport system ATP-binding protein